MAGQVLSVPRSLGVLFDIGAVGQLADGQLLERFAAGHREASELAFHALVERHGPMVWRVCRRRLDDPNDAEDAFQATFLVLLRRAGAIRDRGSVAAWLHGVAARVSARARVEAARRARIERRGARAAIGRDDVRDRLDIGVLLDEELARLPEKYRAPVVLCYLQGMTHEAAAARLGWPVGTVRGRLSRARDLLRSRLTRRGVTAVAAVAAFEGLSDPAGAAVPVALREATARIASGSKAVIPPRVAGWAVGAARGLVLRRIMTAASVLLLIGSVGTGLALLGTPPQERRETPPDGREAIRREMLRLKGTWAAMGPVVENDENGVPRPPKLVKFVWSIDRDRITESDQKGFAEWTFRFDLDLARSPRTIDLTSLNAGLVLHGNYRLDGETLTVCYGHDRPRGFEAGPSDIRMVFHRESRTPAPLSPEFPNADGCFWASKPGGVPRSSASGHINLIVRKDDGGAMVVVLAYLSRLADRDLGAEYRLVAFDRDRRRHLFQPGPGGWSTSAAFGDVALAHQEYRLDPAVLPHDRVKDLGVEVVPAEVRRAEELKASDRATREARDAGIAILPRPEVGRPFAFSLTDATGRVLRSSDLKGKVVLIDCWASWSGPCTEKLPRLKELYERRRGQGFEVIGLNFDSPGARGRAERMVKAMGLPWPQVFVPGDDRTRRLWREGPGLPSYPRSLLIDRKGILRFDGRPDELEARIDAWLE